MKIEGNQKELDAMVEFHKGNRVEGLRLQEEFAAKFRKEYKDKDHCPCLKACRYHGNCKECVAIHRAHQEHVPNCMRPLINKKLKLMSELTEHKDSTQKELQQEQETLLEEIAALKVPLTEVQEDLKKLRDIRYWVRKATPGTEESKEPPKKQPIKEILQDKTDEKKSTKNHPGTGETQTTGYGTLTGTCHFQSENVRCFFFFRRDRFECI